MVLAIAVTWWLAGTRPVESTAATPTAATSPEPVAEEPEKKSIAVLPFVNMSNDPEQEYFSDGLTEDLITDLSRISGLFVIARNSTFVYKGQAANIQNVGRELGVRYVLEGSVRKVANRVRVNAQLIDVASGMHLWADRYDRELTDVFALQDEVTRTIVAALAVSLTDEDEARMRGVANTNPEAYDALLRGNALFSRYNPKDNADARDLYAQMGRIEDAKWQADELLTLRPDFAIRSDQNTRGFRVAEHEKRYIEGLRGAGLPE